jgi:signal transduction histidine kinase/CheY-like chemotaxis protein
MSRVKPYSSFFNAINVTDSKALTSEAVTHATRLTLRIPEYLETRQIAVVLALAGGSYPAWWLISPHTGNPVLPWIAIGGAYLGVGLLTLVVPKAFCSQLVAIPVLAVTLHLEILYWQNPQEPFYAVAALMSVAVALPILRGKQVRNAYFGVVIALSIGQLLIGGLGTGFLGICLAVTVALLGRHVVSREQVVERLDEVAKELVEERTERKRLLGELELVQRMDSLGRLAGAFSHEFNNQLMAIRVHADLLERTLPKDAPQRRDIARIQQTTSSAADLTSRLLAFSRPSRSREEPADLCAVLRQNHVTLLHLMSENTTVEFHAPEVEVYAPVGAKHLGQILLNLGLNARDAMPNGGSLRVDLACMPSSSVELPIDIPVQTLVRLSVSDTGAGMSEGVRDQIFEPFFTTKAERGNSGLGLSVVYGIVKETGGHIRVTSEPGHGSRFDLYWPLVSPVAAHAHRRARGEAGSAGRAQVLLVEDQSALREGLGRWLRDQGYGVIACESAEEALSRASDVDVIASDVVLPGMDGIELVARLRSAAPALPAVLFSGHVDHLATRRREVPNGVPLLEKPFAPETLATAIDGLVVESQRVVPFGV